MYIQNLFDRFLKFSGLFFLPFINWSGECQGFDCTDVEWVTWLHTIAGLGLVAICLWIVVTRLSLIRVGDEEWVGGPQKKSPKESKNFWNPPTPLEM